MRPAFDQEEVIGNLKGKKKTLGCLERCQEKKMEGAYQDRREFSYAWLKRRVQLFFSNLCFNGVLWTPAALLIPQGTL